ncbi:sialidase family protein [Prosthecobacter sp.]|uniref:sialidase family protein n=1 Tax=Prosthecobacter sp. TaxID=1965333 RepID=UPI00248A15F5|nr:sialidase family protein [Prosthecobacter sp.]MDI1310911.1 sialidase family protein [Prosthecobacter sp.]
MKKSIARLLLLLLPVFAYGTEEVRFERVPEGGVQPQVVTTRDGALHLVYLKGDPRGCDIRYVTKKAGDSAWSTPRTVNSTPATAIAAGTIRGAQIAVGRDDSLHVVWNGAGGKDQPAPLLYTRSLNHGATFEKQRDLRAGTQALDGGASVAASAPGEVFVVWHGAPAGAAPGEINRRVFVLKSADNGGTFSKPRIANGDDPGVCACCSLKTFVSPTGELLTLYRAARSMAQRDITLMSSKDGGATFQHRNVGPWAINACPMSSASVIAAGSKTRAAWEAEGKVYTALLDERSAALAVSEDKARHPALAVNGRGETLVTWSVGTGWQKGGQLGWVVLDAGGKPTMERGMKDGVPVWGFSAAYAEGERFVIVY